MEEDIYIYDVPYCYGGDTFNSENFVIQEAGFDWTGSTVRIQWRKSASADPILSWELAETGSTVALPNQTPVGVTNLDASTLGDLIIPMHVAKDEMDQVPAGTYEYDIEVTHPDGTRTTYVKGKVLVTQQITY